MPGAHGLIEHLDVEELGKEKVPQLVNGDEHSEEHEEGRDREHADSISMAWLWSRLHLRSKSRNGAHEELVYLDGGFKILVDKLLEELQVGKVNLYPNSNLLEIKPSANKGLTLHKVKGQTLKYDKIIVTTPNPVFAKLCPSLPAEYIEKLANVKYRGAMVCVLQLKKQFMN